MVVGGGGLLFGGLLIVEWLLDGGLFIGDVIFVLTLMGGPSTVYLPIEYMGLGTFLMKDGLLYYLLMGLAWQVG